MFLMSSKEWATAAAYINLQAVEPRAADVLLVSPTGANEHFRGDISSSRV